MRSSKPLATAARPPAVRGFITVGAFVTPGTGDRLSAPGEFGPFLGTLVQVIGLAMTVVFGLLATVRVLRKSPA